MALILAAQLALGGARSNSVAPAVNAGKAAAATHVEAADVEYLYKQRRTIMTGKPLVTFRRADATLVCRKMIADNDAAGDIRHAVCEGDVKFTKGDRIVTCQRATYDAELSTIVCRGDPVLQDGLSFLRCEEVIYDIARDRVLAQKSKGTLYQKPGQKLPGAKEQAR